MKRVFKTTWVVAVIALILVFALVLSACENAGNSASQNTDNGTQTVDDNNHGTNDQTNVSKDGDGTDKENGTETNNQTDNNENNNNNNGNTDNEGNQGASLNVTFDADAKYDVESLANIADLLNVAVNVNGQTRNIPFSLKTYDVVETDDGTFIKVVIKAEGMDLEQTVMLPYDTSETPNDGPIREELMPLYELLSKAGDKAYVLDVSGMITADKESKPASFALKAIANVPAQGGVQFALFDENGEDAAVYVLYRDGVLNVGDMTVDITRLTQKFGGMLDGEAIALAEETEEIGDTIGEVEVDFGFDVDFLSIAFESVSGLLDKLDMCVQTNMAATYGVTLTKSDNVYKAETTSDKLLAVIEKLLADEADLGPFVDLLDAQLDGALKAGDLKLLVTLAINENGVSISVQGANAKSGAAVALGLSLKVDDEIIALPEVNHAEAKDIMATVSFVLPSHGENGLTLSVYSVLHISEMFAEEGKDYVTADMIINESKVGTFVLNDNYMYLDITELLRVLDVDMAPTYYQAFESDGEPISLLDLMFDEFMFGGFDYDYNSDYNDDYVYPALSDGVAENDDQVGAIANDAVMEGGEKPYSNICGLGVNPRSTVDYALPVGATEADLRNLLMVTVSYYSAPEDEVELTDYTIEGFDSSSAAKIEVTICIDDYWDATIDVTIYDEEKVTYYAIDVYAETTYFPVGTTLDKVQTQMYCYYTLTDGVSQWQIAVEEFAIALVDSQAPAADYAFTDIGEHTLTIQAKTEDAIFSTAIEVTIYDPDNRKVIGIDCDDSVSASVYATEEDIRKLLTVSLLYNDGSSVEIDDYKIVGFAYGVKSFGVAWGDYVAQVQWMGEADYPNPYDPGYADGDDDYYFDFDYTVILPYLRFVEVEEDDDLATIIEKAVAGIIAILADEANRELLESIVQTIETSYNDGTGMVDVQGLALSINNNNGKDLLAALNLFVGLPTEDGWVDIDENLLLASLASMGVEADAVYDAFKSIIGVDLVDALSDLTLSVSLSTGDNMLGVTVALGGVENGYFAIGVAARPVEQVGQFELTPEAIEAAASFDDLDAEELIMPMLRMIGAGAIVDQILENAQKAQIDVCGHQVSMALQLGMADGEISKKSTAESIVAYCNDFFSGIEFVTDYDEATGDGIVVLVNTDILETEGVVRVAVIGESYYMTIMCDVTTGECTGSDVMATLKPLENQPK